MARSSEANNGEAARATPSKSPAKRVSTPDKGKPAAAAKGRARPSGAEPKWPRETGAGAAPVAPMAAASEAEPTATGSPAEAEPPASRQAAPEPTTPEPTAPIEATLELDALEDRRSAPEPEAPTEPVAATPVAEAASEPEPLPAPRPAADLAPNVAALLRASRTLVEGSIRARTQMIGFGCRQAEQGLAVSRAMLASGSLPEALALQTRYLGRAVEDALAQTLELNRLSTDVVRAGLDSLRPD